MPEPALTLRYGHREHQPPAVPRVRLAHEAVDAGGALLEQCGPLVGQRPRGASAVPLGDEETLGAGAGERLARGTLLDVEPPQGLENGGGPHRALPGQRELAQHGQQERPGARRADLSPAVQRCRLCLVHAASILHTGTDADPDVGSTGPTILAKRSVIHRQAVDAPPYRNHSTGP